MVHKTPRWCMGDPHYRGEGFDAVVLVVRSSYPNARSMLANGHAYDNEGRIGDLGLAYRMVPEAIWAILHSLESHENVHVITYEALVNEPEALRMLCRDLGLLETFEHDEIGDANSKHYLPERKDLFFADQRPLEERN